MLANHLNESVYDIMIDSSSRSTVSK